MFSKINGLNPGVSVVCLVWSSGDWPEIFVSGDLIGQLNCYVHVLQLKKYPSCKIVFMIYLRYSQNSYPVHEGDFNNIDYINSDNFCFLQG